MGKWILALALGLLLPAVAVAQNKPLKLDVRGQIGIDHSGAVYDYKIITILTPEVTKMVDRAVRKWTFEPVVRNGKPVYARSDMHLTLSAIPVEKGYRLEVDFVRFSGSRQSKKKVPPRYPEGALRMQLGATVLVAVRVDKDGDVVDAAAVQSRLLNVRRSDRSMEQRFERVSVDAAKHWKFEPADIAAGDDPDVTMIVPISFTTGDSPQSSAGWWVDRGGSQHPIPWLPADKQQYDANGLQDGESIALGNPMRLKQPVEGKAL